MTTHKEALTLALEALCTCGPQQKQAITAIKEALAQPEQEPVACTSLCVECTKRGDWVCAKAIPPQRTWVGLTDEDVRQCSKDVAAGGKENCVDRFAYAIEAKLKEKNA